MLRLKHLRAVYVVSAITLAKVNVYFSCSDAGLLIHRPV